jgi:purine-nucleoside phosphorylase
VSIPRATGRSDFKVAVALGSGLGAVARSLVGDASVAYSEIDGMPPAVVAGHEGRLYHGEVEGVPVLAFAGRAHLYEGHDAEAVTRWVRLAAEAGCEIVILTNAAGAIRAELTVGAPCLIADHLNLTGTNPLVGPNDDRLGPRFPDLSEVYDRRLRDLARAVEPDIPEGVYAGLLGPTYETPAEIRMLRTLGADLVGMSTVNEAIMARYLRLRVLGISIVTNRAAGVGDGPLDHEEVKEAGAAAAPRLERLLRGVIARL